MVKDDGIDVIRIKDQLRLFCRGWRRMRSYTDMDGREISPEYPKAMMTCKQIALGTATINCGNDTPANVAEAEKIMFSRAFLKFLDRTGCKCKGIERVPGCVQIRIRYGREEDRKRLPEI